MSSRNLIKSMLVIGSARAVNILISLTRMKALALLLGPAGVGLLSVYSSLQDMVATAAGLGMSSSGVREIASARGEESALSRVRRVLFTAHLVQGTLAMLFVWLLRERLAIWLLGDASRAMEIGLVGIAILLTLLSASQTALLQGLRRIGDLGRVTVLAAFAGTIAGVAAVWMAGRDGLILFVIVQPLASVLAAVWYARKLPRPTSSQPNLGAIWATWQPMAKLGFAFMMGTLAAAATLLLVRSYITRELGLHAAGQFAAAWGISMTYIGFLLSTMSAEYYPRLAEVINDRDAANQLMNDQAQLGLATGGPILLLLIGCAPWAIHLLYSSEFNDAVTLLQWQTVGNVFKLASWPLGFAFVAAARSSTFLFLQLNFNILFLAILWFGFPVLGLEVAGVGFLATYVLHFFILHILAGRLQGFRWQSLSLKLIATHALLSLGLLALALTFPRAGAAIAAVLSVATALVGGHIVLTKIGPKGRFVAPLARIYAAMGWPVRSTI